jgi:hypothetical protein
MNVDTEAWLTGASPLSHVLAETVENLANNVEHHAPSLDFDQAVHLLVAIRNARQQLADAYAVVEKHACREAGEKRAEVAGVGVVEVKGNVRRVKWDTESLRRAVLDSRLVNQETGELVDETPLDKVLQVWNLGTPRVTALRARGLDPDEFCAATFEGWQIRLP